MLHWKFTINNEWQMHVEYTAWMLNLEIYMIHFITKKYNINNLDSCKSYQGFWYELQTILYLIAYVAPDNVLTWHSYAAAGLLM